MSSVLKSIEYQKNMLIKEMKRIKAEVNELEFKKEIISKLKTICPSCKGTGEERYTDAAGSGDWRECSICKGLGKIGNLKCSCGREINIEMKYSYKKRLCPYCGSYLYFE